MTAVAFLINGQAGSTLNTASTTGFQAIAGGWLAVMNTTEARAQHKIGTVGTIGNLAIVVATNTRTTNTVYGIRLNGADGGSPSTIAITYGSGVTGTKTDTTNTVTVAVGDTVDLSVTTGSGSGNIRTAMNSATFAATSGTTFAIAYWNATGMTLNGTGPITDFIMIAGNNSVASSTTEANAQILVPVAGTAKYLTMMVNTNTRSTSSTVVTFRKNSGNGSQTFTYTASQTGTKTDTSNSDALSANDLICVSPALGTGTGNFIISLCGMTFDATSDGSSFFAAGVPGGLSFGAGTTNNEPVGGAYQGASGSEAQSSGVLAVAAKGSNLWCIVLTNASTTNATFILRRSAGDGNQSASITALTTGTFQDTSNSDSISALALINYRLSNITTGAVVVSAVGMQVVTSANTNLAPSAGTLTITGQIPVLGLGVFPSAGSLTLTGNAPKMGFGLNPAAGSLVITGVAPTVTIVATGISLTPGSGTLVITGNAPVLDFGFFPNAGALVLTGLAPSLANNLGLSPGAGSLVITGVAPALANNLGLSPGSATLVVTGNTPTMGFGLNPPSGSLTLNGNAPNVGFGMFPASGTLVITGLAPSMAAGLSLFPGAGALALSGLAPILGFGLFPSAGTLVITGVVPIAHTGFTIAPPSGTLTITGFAPSAGISYFFSPPSGTLTITGNVPFGGVSYFITPPSGSLVLNGFAAHIKIRHIPIFFNPDYVFSFWESEIVDFIGYSPVSLEMFIQYRDDNQALYLNVDRLTLQRVIDLFNNNLDANNVLNGLRSA